MEDRQNKFRNTVIILIVLFLALIYYDLIHSATPVQALPQRIELDFPKLSGETVWIYTFSGSRVDSVNIRLDNRGKASVDYIQIERNVSTKSADYQGIAYFHIPEKGGGDFILSEKRLLITCPEEQFHGGMLEFPQSAENKFFRYVFQRKAYLSGQMEWLKAGEGFRVKSEELRVKGEEGFDWLYDKMVEENAREIRLLEDTVKKSSFLYAARLYEVIQYMQELYNTVQSLDQVQIKERIEEMENDLDIRALYHSGNLWTDVHNYYQGLFVGADADSVQTVYARSILTTLKRLEDPFFTAFLTTALTVCERTNRTKAQEVMLNDFIRTYPALPVHDPMLLRYLGLLNISKGSQAPPVAGLSRPLSGKAILIFFESDCALCVNEVEQLIKRYGEFSEKGYRIVSVSADIHDNNYMSFSARFPWDKADRLCDFKGFGGDNFKNFGIIGTPTIFVIDENGIIKSKNAAVSEIKNF